MAEDYNDINRRTDEIIGLEGILEDRRHIETAAVLQLVTHMSDKLTSVESKLDVHMKEETTQLAAEIAKLMLSAFPEGDAGSHRREHEAAIKKSEARAEFWATMAKEITKAGLIGFLAWAGYAIWRALLLGPK